MRTRPLPNRVIPIAIVATLALTGLAFGGALEGGEEASAEEAITAETAGDATEVVLYYFHGNRRCNTCRSIESYAQEAIEGKFEEALQAGTLDWRVLNTDESEYAHFVKDFGLVSSSLVVVEVNGEKIVRHEVLQDAWTLVRDKGRFIQYIQGSVGEFLE